MGKSVPGGADKQSLTVTDNRTGKTFEVPIKDNSIPATFFKEFKIAKSQNPGREEDEVEAGIRVFDPSYMNTAVIRCAAPSELTQLKGCRHDLLTTTW